MTSDVPSQDRLLDELDSGVDVSQIDERLALSPTERLERMRQFLVFLDGMKTGDGDRLRTASPHIAATADVQHVYGVRVLVMSLDDLERAKRAA